MVGAQLNLAGAIQFEVKVDLFEWLVITAKGQGLNFSTSIPANTSRTFEIPPPQGYDYILYHGIQWDGITPGTVTFDMRGGTNSITAGFAVQAFIQDELFITDRGRPIRLQVTNGSTAPVVLNIDYVALTAQIWEREVLPVISPVIPGGH
jgi:hypothetical protein